MSVFVVDSDSMLMGSRGTTAVAKRATLSEILHPVFQYILLTEPGRRVSAGPQPKLARDLSGKWT